MNDESFHEVRFPVGISFGSSGGPERNTQIVALGSGREKRNQRWAHSKRRYDAGYGVKDLNALHAVVAFYEARRGPLFGFRFRDVVDWKSCEPLAQPSAQDQTLGAGDGQTTSFQLVKTYGEFGAHYTRAIKKPVLGSVRIAVDGVEQDEGADFTISSFTGTVEFTASATPASAAIITAGYEFDVPVRFASDQLTVSLSAFKAGDMPSIPLVEISV